MRRTPAGSGPSLAIRGAGLTLVSPNAAVAFGLARAAGETIHPPGPSPFAGSWSSAPPPARRRYVAALLAAPRRHSDATRLVLALAVLVAGEVLGCQELVVARVASGELEVVTRSWLVQRAQGGGLGTAMREAALHLAFDRLGAARARSSSFRENIASRRVAQKCGYEADGEETVTHEGAPTKVVCLVLERSRYLARPHPGFVVAGHGPVVTACARLVAPASP